MLNSNGLNVLNTISKKMDPSTKLRNLDIARASSQIIVIMLPALVESQ